jgi:hypothetical protein
MLKPSDLAKQFDMANKQLTEYTRKKAKEVAEEFTETVEKVHRRFSIEPIPVTLLTWVMNFLTDLNIEFKLVTSEKMLREAKSMMGKRTNVTKKKRQRETRKNPEETDVT